MEPHSITPLPANADAVRRSTAPAPQPIDPKLMAEIRKTKEDATFGYTTVTCQLYSRHVGALLAEVGRLQNIVNGLADRVAAQSEPPSKRAEKTP